MKTIFQVVAYVNGARKVVTVTARTKQGAKKPARCGESRLASVNVVSSEKLVWGVLDASKA